MIKTRQNLGQSFDLDRIKDVHEITKRIQGMQRGKKLDDLESFKLFSKTQEPLIQAFEKGAREQMEKLDSIETNQLKQILQASNPPKPQFIVSRNMLDAAAPHSYERIAGPDRSRPSSTTATTSTERLVLDPRPASAPLYRHVISHPVAETLRSIDSNPSGLELSVIENGSDDFKYKLGKYVITFNEDKMFVKGKNEPIQATKGLMLLLTKKNPKADLYTKEEKKIYLDLIFDSGAYLFNPNDETSKPISSKGMKWLNIVSPEYYRRKEKKTGSGKLQKYEIAVPTSDKELMQKIELSIAEIRAGNDNLLPYIRRYLKEALKRKILRRYQADQILDYAIIIGRTLK